MCYHIEHKTENNTQARHHPNSAILHIKTQFVDYMAKGCMPIIHWLKGRWTKLLDSFEWFHMQASNLQNLKIPCSNIISVLPLHNMHPGTWVTIGGGPIIITSHIRRSNIIGPVCLSVCLSVCLRSHSWTTWPMTLIFGMEANLDPSYHGIEGQGKTCKLCFSV